VNPAFEPTSILGSHAGAGAVRDLPRWIPRACQFAAALLALLALALAVLAAMSPPQAQPEAALACAVLALGVLRLASAAQRRSLAARGWLDAGTGLGNRQALGEVGAGILQAARRDRRQMTAVVLDFADLLEVREIYGRQVGQRVLARVVRKVQAIAGAHGTAFRTGKAQFTVLLPGANRDKAQAAVQRALGSPCRVEFDAGDSEIVLVPEVLAEVAAPDVETIDELYQELARALAEQREYEKRRQHWLARERERHSRPMALS
jgi:diguanylate cyclase (GGDEF)-like protein